MFSLTFYEHLIVSGYAIQLNPIEYFSFDWNRENIHIYSLKLKFILLMSLPISKPQMSWLIDPLESILYPKSNFLNMLLQMSF